MNILENPEQSSYFQEVKYATILESIDNTYKHFSIMDKEIFLERLSHYPNNKQAGYSRSKECDYLGLILVLTVYYNDGSCYHEIKNTFLISKDNIVSDVSGSHDGANDDLSFSVRTVYHPLPDGKLIEIPIKDNYKDEVNDIYQQIKNIRATTENKKSIKP